MVGSCSSFARPSKVRTAFGLFFAVVLSGLGPTSSETVPTTGGSNWSLVTGVAVPEKVQEHIGVSCAC
jgi:hypothetical protein